MLGLTRAAVQLPPANGPSKVKTKKPKFYAVLVGRTPGIYRTWAEVEAQIKNFPGCLHKSFKTEEEAQAWLAQGTPVRKAAAKTPKKPKRKATDTLSPLPFPLTPAQAPSSTAHLSSPFSPFSPQSSLHHADHHRHAINAEDIPLAFYIKGHVQKKRALQGALGHPTPSALPAPQPTPGSSMRYLSNGHPSDVDPAALSLANLQPGSFPPGSANYHAGAGGFGAGYQGGSWAGGSMRFAHGPPESYDDEQQPWGLDRPPHAVQQPHPPHQQGYPPHQHQARGTADGLSRVPVDPNMKYHLEFDGASKGNPGKAGAGAVLKDPWGKELYRITEGIAHGTCNHAEYRALLAGLQVALGLGVRRIHVQGDSKLVVMQSQGKWKVAAESLVPLAAEARTLLKTFEDAEIVHVERAYNTLADMLANQAVDLMDGRRMIIEMRSEDASYDAFAHIK